MDKRTTPSYTRIHAERAHGLQAAASDAERAQGDQSAGRNSGRRTSPTSDRSLDCDPTVAAKPARTQHSMIASVPDR